MQILLSWMSRIFPYYSKLKHEKLCNFRPYVCPREVENATWVLTMNATNFLFDGRQIKAEQTPEEVFHCFGHNFCLHCEAFLLGMAPIYMAFLRFMGDENDARTYTYSLEVGAKWQETHLGGYITKYLRFPPKSQV